MKTMAAWTDKNKEKVWLQVFLNMLILVLLLCAFRPAYETNDDMAICNLVSGVKGVYSPYLIYSNYLLGLILSACYQAFHDIPWYALFQYALLFAAFTAILHVLICRLKSMSGFWLALIIVSFFSYEGYIKLQYTKSAGIASAAGILLILHALDQQKPHVPALLCGYVLTGMGFMYRGEQCLAEGFLMTGIAVYLLFGLSEVEAGKRLKRFLTYLGGAAGLLCVLAVLYLADVQAYRSSEWQEYLEFNENRTQLLDYGFPDYEENEEAYLELGIDNNALKLYRSWNFLDTEKFTTEILEQLVALKEKKTIDRSLILSFIREISVGLFSVPSFCLFLAFCIFWLLWGGHRRQEWAVVAFESAVTVFLYFYLYVQGRYLYNRVDVGIWLAVTLVLMWTWMKGKNAFPNKAGVALLVMVLCISQNTWRKNWRINTTDERQEMLEEREVLQTIHDDTEHLYLTKVGLVSPSDAYGVFETAPFGIMENCYSLGGWPANTPVNLDGLEKYGVTNPYRDMIGNDQIYLIDNRIEVTLKYIQTYYKSDAEAVLVSEIGDLKIYQII